MSRRSVAVFLDPAGERHHLPTWPWGYAPDHLATRSQLREMGLRPGGQDPAGQIMWRSRRAGHTGGVRSAALYRIDLAVPVRPMTPARERALARALLARHTCRTCGVVWDCCLPTSMGGHCPPCYHEIPNGLLEAAA
ncbi:hypothetical protein GCM10027294_53380 [Marinactinospora endophytica]